MAQGVKALHQAWRLKFSSLDPCSERKKKTPVSWPVTFAYALWHAGTSSFLPCSQEMQKYKIYLSSLTHSFLSPFCSPSVPRAKGVHNFLLLNKLPPLLDPKDYRGFGKEKTLCWNGSVKRDVLMVGSVGGRGLTKLVGWQEGGDCIALGQGILQLQELEASLGVEGVLSFSPGPLWACKI